MIVTTGPDIVAALPIIISLIIIEGLLSVDNALAIATMASQLPPSQQQRALRLGIIGAYLFRGAALALAAYVIANPWIRLVGAAYLLYLMSKNLGVGEGDGDEEHVPKGKSFLLTIIQIEILDLSLSIDNVVAAVALSPKLWVVWTGVFIGILAMRFLAGYCIRLLEKFPILAKTAFLLVGYVGVILLFEEAARMRGHVLHVESTGKFVGIVLIVLATLLYSRSEVMRRLTAPIIYLSLPIMRGFAAIGDALAWPLLRIVQLFRRENIAVS